MGLYEHIVPTVIDDQLLALFQVITNTFDTSAYSVDAIKDLHHGREITIDVERRRIVGRRTKCHCQKARGKRAGKWRRLRRIAQTVGCADNTSCCILQIAPYRIDGLDLCRGKTAVVGAAGTQ